MAGSMSDPTDANQTGWTPDARALERSRLLRLVRRTGSSSYADLLDRVAAHPEWYWREALDDLGLAWHRPYDRIRDLSRGKAWPAWFPGAGFNYVDSALDRHARSDAARRVAVIWEGDDGSVRTLTFAELAAMTDAVAAALLGLGIRPGDRVGMLLPMLPETVAAVLACGKIGAVLVPLFSGYGEGAIVTRLADCEARLLITADGFQRRGNLVPLKEVADRALVRLPGIAHCLVLRHAGIACDWDDNRDRWWHDLVVAVDPVATRETAADDPCMILYTSGTTGRPKGAVHIHAGFPIKAAHDLAYCFDVGADDTVFWLTDLGWMMGPWLIMGALTLGAAIVLLEGTPDHPGPDRLWRMVERHRISLLGLAPTAVRALMPHGNAIVSATDRSSLRALGSTGETWNPEPWRWLFEVVGERRCPIVNYSGGTETSGGIVASFPGLPMKPCAFAGPVPGMVADVVDDEGHPLRNGVGELVLREPWVGMTNGLWKDPGRYEDTYWSRFPDIWVHGDFAEIDTDGAWFIRGRSDDTLNIAGKRIGPAELESAAVMHPAVGEAAAISVPHPVKGEVAVVFVLVSGEHDPNALAEEVRRSIGRQLGAALRPERVEVVGDLPRTRNAKIMRRVIRAAWLGEPQGDMSALENPAAESAIRRLGETSGAARTR